MPLLDNITLMPGDLDNILELLRQKKHQGPIKIIDTHGTITVRDGDEQYLGDVVRAEQNQNNDSN